MWIKVMVLNDRQYRTRLRYTAFSTA
uniref:Uncharacterized protein n=1 Tax=Anguilla anguilla TaxID=7936 RepID=A0A0E9S3L8_ANGAN